MRFPTGFMQQLALCSKMLVPSILQGIFQRDVRCCLLHWELIRAGYCMTFCWNVAIFKMIYNNLCKLGCALTDATEKWLITAFHVKRKQTLSVLKEHKINIPMIWHKAALVCSLPSEQLTDVNNYGS